MHVNVVYCHHEPEAAGEFRQYAALAHLADTLACALGLGSDGDSHVRPMKIKRETWEGFGLTFEDLDSILLETFEADSGFEAFFLVTKDSWWSA